MTTTAITTTTTTPTTKSISESLSSLISLSDSLSSIPSFASDCSAISSLLRSLARLLSTSSPPFLPPFLRILSSTSLSLRKTLSLHRRSPLRRLLSPSSSSSLLRKSISLLQSSQADLRWLLSLYNNSDGPSSLPLLGLPPISISDPILSLVWIYSATVHSVSRSPSDRADAALSLNSLALDNDRNKKIIIEEGGVGPLVSLLKNGTDLDCQLSAATALCSVTASAEAVEALINEDAVPLLVHLLGDITLSINLTTSVAGIVSRMASHHPIAQEEFARENVVRPLVSLLSFDVPLEEPASLLSSKKKSSIHSIVQDMSSHSSSSSTLLKAYQHQSHRKGWENSSEEAKAGLKIACADALWKLSKGCLSNCRKITETKALLCLAKMIETEKGELQYYCLMIVQEIAEAAEVDADLRRSAFKMNSPAVKAVVEQLMRVIQQGSSATLQIAAMRAIGCLSRTFPAKEIKVLNPIVVQLGHWNADVAAEAAKALCKFVRPDNFLCVEHSNAIVEFSAMPVIMRLLRAGDKPQIPALTLVCYLALSIPKNEALDSAKALTTLQSVVRTPLAQEPSVRDLLPKAIHQLELYQLGSHRQVKDRDYSASIY